MNEKPLTPLREEDYEAIEAAVMETERGRWFLAEFTVRNRSADTRILLDAIQKLEKNITRDRGSDDMDRVRMELADMASAIQRTKQEIADIQGDTAEADRFTQAANELDAIVNQTEKATQDILNSAEMVQEMAWTLREKNADPEISDTLDHHATEIYTACSFQDLTGQRTRKVVNVLAYLEAHINRMIDIWGSDEITDIIESVDARPEPPHVDPDAHLLNGPQLEGHGMDQSAIDDLLVDADFDTGFDPIDTSDSPFGGNDESDLAADDLPEAVETAVVEDTELAAAVSSEDSSVFEGLEESLAGVDADAIIADAADTEFDAVPPIAETAETESANEAAILDGPALENQTSFAGMQVDVDLSAEEFGEADVFQTDNAVPVFEEVGDDEADAFAAIASDEDAATSEPDVADFAEDDFAEAEFTNGETMPDTVEGDFSAAEQDFDAVEENASLEADTFEPAETDESADEAAALLSQAVAIAEVDDTLTETSDVDIVEAHVDIVEADLEFVEFDEPAQDASQPAEADADADTMADAAAMAEIAKFIVAETSDVELADTVSEDDTASFDAAGEADVFDIEAGNDEAADDDWGLDDSADDFAAIDAEDAIDETPESPETVELTPEAAALEEIVEDPEALVANLEAIAAMMAEKDDEEDPTAHLSEAERIALFS
ncbi:MAG: hypothetical protein C0606_12425 [Hyphomicrobiales bacterium]|nr:MAG: hypothetical protein C0606_12425 [Hyphomicrobiales bacterium]